MMMSEVAKRLVALCQEGKEQQVVDELYADDIISIEAFGSEERPARIEGLDAVKEKHQWFYANFEVHGMTVEGPFIASSPDKFIVIFGIDSTDKGTGQRTQEKECALYTVRDGTIVEEEFFYPQG